MRDSWGRVCTGPGPSRARTDPVGSPDRRRATIGAMEPLFATERTIVRPWRHEEAPRLLDLLSRMEVLRWLDDDPVPLADLDAAHEKISAFHRRTVAGTPIGFWAVEERATGVAAGTVLLCELPDVQEGAEPTRPEEGLEVGWHLHPDAWGRGLAREAAAGLVAAAFAADVVAVNALMYVDNDASARVAGAIGLRERPRSDDRWYAGPSRHFALTAAEHATGRPRT